MATRRRTKTTAAGLTAAAGLLMGLVAAPAQATRVQQACAEPYAPIVYAATYPQQEPVPSVPGTEVFSRIVDVAVPIDPAPTSTFERAGSYGTTIAGLGDLNGDARDEYAVTVLNARPDAAPDGTYVIDGTLTPGTYDPADVGLQVSDGFTADMGDRDDDGFRDFAVSGTVQNPSSSVVLYDGATIGAALTSLPADGRSIGVLANAPGTLVGRAAIDPALPTLVTFEAAGSEARIHLIDEDRSQAFSTAPNPVLYEYVGPPAPSVLTGPEGTYLIYNPSDRSGSAWYLWRVDDPCGALPTGTIATTTPATVPSNSPTSAVPATPVSGGATYTG